MTDQRWPIRILDALDREPRVGDWFAMCCEEDLEQITTQEDLNEIYEMMLDEDLGWGRFWPTREAAMAELSDEAWLYAPLTDAERKSTLLDGKKVEEW